MAFADFSNPDCSGPLWLSQGDGLVLTCLNPMGTVRGAAVLAVLAHQPQP